MRKEVATPKCASDVERLMSEITAGKRTGGWIMMFQGGYETTDVQVGRWSQEAAEKVRGWKSDH
jgi:hypothetical protein